MRNLEALAKVLLVIGATLLVLANVAAIGYVLYLWSGIGMAFGAAAWTGFKLWLAMELGGLLIVAQAYLFNELA